MEAVGISPAGLRDAAILAGGAAGALARAALAEAFPRGAGEWPWATFGANIAGSLPLAWLTTRLTAEHGIVTSLLVPGYRERAGETVNGSLFPP